MANPSVERMLREHFDRMRAANITLAQNWAAQLEGQARDNAPWVDRTGNARIGLQGKVALDGDDVIIALAHSMEYGVWLELCNDGRYAILGPTMDANVADIKASYEELWRG